MEQRLQMMEQALQELRDRNLQLQGALEEQRALATAAASGSAKPAAREFCGIIDTRLIGKAIGLCRNGGTRRRFRACR